MKRLFLLFLSLGVASTFVSAQFVPLGAQLDGNAPNDNFGWSVSLDASGRILAVGAPLYDDDFGQVRVYQETGGVWTQMGNDIEGITIGEQLGFSLALSADGKRVAVGGISGQNTQGGQVRVYQLSGNQWTLLGNPILAEATGDQFGFSVDINAAGTRLVVGARNNSGNGTEAGQVRVYTWQNNDWVQLGIDIDGEAAGDRWGTSVSMNEDGTVIAAGAEENADGGAKAGHVRIYEWLNSTWTQRGNDIDGQNANEFLGKSVSLSDDGLRLIVSASNHDYGTGFGSVRVYEWTNNAWTQMGNDLRSGTGSVTEGFGEAVAISGNGQRIAIGTRSADENAFNSGRTNLYEWSNNQWNELTPPILGNAQFDQLGKSVALNVEGNRVGNGANLAGGTQGYVVVYQDSLMPVGIDRLFEGPAIQIFQTSAGIQVQAANQLRQVQIKIMDLTGRLVFRDESPRGNHFIFHPSLAPGVYAVHVRHSQGWAGTKIWIQP